MGLLLLGLAGDMVSSDAAPSYFTTRVGGCPAFPGTVPPNGSESITCLVCKNPLSLIVQAYAPLAAPDVTMFLPHRTILVYGCTQPNCGRKAGSWRSFTASLIEAPRVTKAAEDVSGLDGEAVDKASNTSSLIDPPKAVNTEGAVDLVMTAGSCSKGEAAEKVPDASTAVANVESASGGGINVAGTRQAVEEDDWEDDWTGQSEKQTDPFDFSDLNRALEASQSKSADVSSSHKHGDKGGQTKGHNGAGETKGHSTLAEPEIPTVTVANRGCLLPEFYLEAVEEPDPASAWASRAETRRALELMSEYEREGQGGLGASTAGVPEGSEDGDSEGGGTWAGEEYEPDQVKGVVSSYLKFSQRLQLCPEQAVRYKRNGQLLWPLSSAPDPTICPRCKAPRSFEMQLMAPLSALILEAASWAEPEHVHELEAGANAAANWEWVTVAVFTCCEGCERWMNGELDRAELLENFVAIVLEDECHE